MFRTQQNSFDEVVAKATDENLTSENWEYILDVCDTVQGSESGPKDAVAAMIKRLAHRNANVQLYTLELANALSQNCGPKMHRELASRSFTDALLRLAGDRTTHQQVKSKILERIAEWSKMFSSNAELGIMDQAFMKLKSQNPNLQPPQAPTKRQITNVDRQKEEEELQMALKLSIQEKPEPSAGSSNKKSNVAELSGHSSTAEHAPSAPSEPVPSSGTTAATVSRVRALFDFQPSEPGELQFRKGDVIAVLESVYKDWWRGSLRGQTGIFPLNYVEKLSDPTQEELDKEAHMEAEVFGQIKNVEKLLALLSTGSGQMNGRDNEEITDLYHQTVAIRPKLIELIGKYTQKKDDFQQLNEKFIKARRDYEALLEQSMSQPQYGRPPAQLGYGYGGGPPPQGPPAQGFPPQRFYSPQPDTQAPNGPVPFQYPPQQQQQQQQPLPQQQQQSQSHPPYPIATPPPSNRTPSNQMPPLSNSVPPPEHYPPQQPQHHPSSSMYPQSLQSGSRPHPAQQTATPYDQHQQQVQPPQSYPTPQPQELGPASPPAVAADADRSSYPPSTTAAGVQSVHQQHGQSDYSPSVYSPDDVQQPPHPSQPPHPQSQPPPPPSGYAPLPSQRHQQQQQQQQAQHGQAENMYAQQASQQHGQAENLHAQQAPQQTQNPYAPPSAPQAGGAGYGYPDHRHQQQQPQSQPPPPPQQAFAQGVNPASFYR